MHNCILSLIIIAIRRAATGYGGISIPGLGAEQPRRISDARSYENGEMDCGWKLLQQSRSCPTVPIVPAKGVGDGIWEMGLRDNFSYRRSLEHNFGSPTSFGPKAKYCRRERSSIVVLGDPDVEGGGLMS